MDKSHFISLYHELNSENIQDVITGDTGFAEHDNIKIWYEHRKTQLPKKASLIFVMGLEMDCLTWPNSLLDSFTENGFDVIRFDNRCTGLSTFVRNTGDGKFSLHEMANDINVLMQHLQIEKAILVGASMGGMIVQKFAIDFPEKILAGVSMMSSGNIYDKAAGGTNWKTMSKIILNNIKKGVSPTEERMLWSNIKLTQILKGDAHENLNYKQIGKQLLYNYRIRKVRRNFGGIHQIRAIRFSGSRNELLQHIQTPFLIIHGIKDPLIPVEHSYKLAELIPNNDTLFIQEMGHVFSDSTQVIIVEKMLTFFEKTLM